MGTVDIEQTLSKDIREVAFIANNGELAWKREHVKKAIEEIVKKGYSILGGEVWTMVPNDKPIELHLTSGTYLGEEYKISGSVLSEKYKVPTIYNWTTDETNDKPEGMNYSEWSAKVALNWLKENDVESITLKEYRNNVFYNLTLGVI